MAAGSLLGVSVLELRTDQAQLDTGLAKARATADAETAGMQKTVDKRVASMGSSMRKVGGSMSRYVTAPIVGIGIATADMAQKFDAAMEMIHTQAGAPQAEVDRLKQKVLDLAHVLPQSPQQLAEGLFHLESIGLRGAKAMDALKIAAQGAAVGNANLEDTATALGSAWLVNIKGSGDLQKVMGVLNATVGAGNMRMEDLVGALGTGVLPAAKLAGLSLQDVSGALAVLSDEGTNATRGANLLRTSLHFLTDPTAKAATALQTIGLNADSMAEDMRKPRGLLLALTDLKSHLDGLSPVKQEQLLGDLFPAGRGWVLQTLLNQLDRYSMKLNQIQRNSDNFGNDVAKTQQTAAYKIHTAFATLEADAIEFGDKVLPGLLRLGGDVVQDVEKITSAFLSLPKSAQDAILTGGLIAAGIGPALKVLGIVTGGVAKLIALEQGAQKLALGQKTLFSNTTSRPGLGNVGSSSVATMEVGEMTVRAMIGSGSTTAGGGWPLSGTRTGEPTTPKTPLGEETVPLTEEAGMGLTGVASRVVGVGGMALGGAGLALLAAPLAVGVFDALSKLFAGKTFGQSRADTIFSHGFGGAQAPDLAKQTASALDALHKFEAFRPVNVGARVLAPEETLNLSQLSGAKLAQALAAANKAGMLVAKSLEAGWDQYKFQSEPIMFDQIRSKLKELPPAAQASAALSAVKFAEKLESEGRLTKGSAARFLSQIESEFPNFEKYLGLAAGAGIREFNTAFNFNKTEANLKGVLTRIGNDFAPVQKAVSDTAGTTQQKAQVAVAALETIAATGTTPMRIRATQDLATLRDATSRDLDAMASDVQTKTRQMVNTIGPNTAAASKIAAVNMGNFSQHVTDAMNNGLISTGKGMALIISTLNKALKEMGQKQLTPLQVASMRLTVGKEQQLNAIGAAQGGMFQFGRPGEGGRDSIPVNMGGVPIMVAPGETGVVLTRHQMAAQNRMLAGHGGLGGWLKSNDRPNYMASGGVVVGASEFGGPGDPTTHGDGGAYGTDVLGSIARLQSGGSYWNKFTPGSRWTLTGPGGKSLVSTVTDWGGGGGPVDGKPRAIDLWWQTANALGLPGTSGQWSGLIDVTPAGVAGSAIGAGAGIAPTVGAPKVTGPGTIGDLVRASMTLGAKGANAYLQSVMPAATEGGGGPVFPIAPGKVPAQVQWALQAAQNIAARRPAYGHLGAGWDLSAYDCSSYVSTVMDAAGIWPKWVYYTAAQPINAHTDPGPGKWITIATRGTSGDNAHTMMEILGHYFESSHFGLGPHVDTGWSEAFDQYRHPKGFAQGGMMAEGQPGHQPTDAQAAILSGTAGAARNALIELLNPGLFVSDTATSVRKPGGPRTGGSTKKPKGTKGHKPMGLIPTGGSGGPGLSSGLFSDIQVINADIGGINNILSTSGALGDLGELLSYWPSMWSLSDPNLGQDATSFIVSTDALGNPVTPYIDWAAVAKSKGELTKELQWEGGTLNLLETGDMLANRLAPKIRTAISKRQTEIADKQRQIRANLKKIQRLQSSEPSTATDPHVLRLKQAINSTSAGSTSLTGLKNDLADAEAITIPSGNAHKSQRAGRARLIAGLRAKINSAQHGQKVSVADLRNDLLAVEEKDASMKAHDKTRITKLEGRNVTLGGSKTSVGTGGEISPLLKQIAGLRTSLGDVTGSGEFGPVTIEGISGVGGQLGPAEIQETTLQGQMAQLAAGPLATALAAASASGGTSSELVSLEQQKNLLLEQQIQVLEGQSRVQLPPFGGSFGSGGIAPGPIGAPLTAILHGGEEIRTLDQQQSGNVRVHVEDHRVRVWVDDVEQIVEQKTRKMSQRVKGLPGARAGQLGPLGRRR